MRLVIQSLESDFNPDALMTEPESFLHKTGEFQKGGLFDEEIFGKLSSYGREYSCECGARNGRFFAGTTCEECGTEVLCQDSLYTRRGWIDLGGHSIIHPLMFLFLKKVIGANYLFSILKGVQEYDQDGMPVLPEKGKLFEGIGMVEFERRFDEILAHFEDGAATSGSEKHLEMIRANRTRVFATKVPVYNHVLRPAIVQRGKNVIFDEVNNLFNHLIRFNVQLQNLTSQERTKPRLDSILWEFQQKLMEVADYVIVGLSSKHGFLRKNVLGTRVNFSARSVITPLSLGHEIDEVHVPYLTFLELFRFQIINILRNTRKCTVLDADEIWAKAQSNFDKDIHALCEELIRSQNGWPALLNRNPSIAFGSILSVRITGVKPDPTDYTFSINNNILRLIGGDYDGDEVNLIPLFDTELVEAFSVFQPQRMMVSRTDYKFNQAMQLSKDHLLGLTILTEDPPQQEKTDDEIIREALELGEPVQQAG